MGATSVDPAVAILDMGTHGVEVSPVARSVRFTGLMRYAHCGQAAAGRGTAPPDAGVPPREPLFRGCELLRC